jgi:Rieske Fe-S protein
VERCKGETLDPRPSTLRLMPCQDCLNRREFLAKSAFAAAALAVVEGCGDGQIGPTAAQLGGGGTIKLADFPGLANVGTIVPIGGNRALVRTSATTFRGLSMICTHEQCVTDVSGNQFVCPCHGSIFRNDGTVVRGPNVANSGIGPLPSFTFVYDQAAGTITITS